MQRFEVGQRVRLLRDAIDHDECDRLRLTPAGSVGEVTAVEDYPGQGVTVYVGVPATGAELVYVAEEFGQIEIVGS